MRLINYIPNATHLPWLLIICVTFSFRYSQLSILLLTIDFLDERQFFLLVFLCSPVEYRAHIVLLFVTKQTFCVPHSINPQLTNHIHSFILPSDLNYLGFVVWLTRWCWYKYTIHHGVLADVYAGEIISHSI